MSSSTAVVGLLFLFLRPAAAVAEEAPAALFVRPRPSPHLGGGGACCLYVRPSYSRKAREQCIIKAGRKEKGGGGSRGGSKLPAQRITE